MQQPAQLGRLALRRHLAELVEPGIEQAPLPNRPVGEFRGQGPVLAHQGLALQLPLQGAVGIGPGRHGLQHLPGHLAGRQTDPGTGGPAAFWHRPSCLWLRLGSARRLGGVGPGGGRTQRGEVGS